MTPSEHAGMRIQMYRKKKKLTLREFAERINKSCSTVSKYESGSIVLDINTLFEIADVLDVSVSQLMDYRKQPIADVGRSIVGNFFQRSDLFYAYTLFSPSRTPYECAMELLRDEEGSDTGSLNFYFDINNTENYTNSSYIYNGRFRCFHQGTYFSLHNPYNHSDVGMIYAEAPFSKADRAKGLFAFTPAKILKPCATGILFSTEPVSPEEDIIPLLSVSGKETVSTLKATNLFMVC